MVHKTLMMRPEQLIEIEVIADENDTSVADIHRKLLDLGLERWAELNG